MMTSLMAALGLLPTAVSQGEAVPIRGVVVAAFTFAISECAEIVGGGRTF